MTFYILTSVVFIILGVIELFRLGYYRWIAHDTPEAAMAGVFALISFWVADKLYEKGMS